MIGGSAAQPIPATMSFRKRQADPENEPRPDAAADAEPLTDRADDGSSDPAEPADEPSELDALRAERDEAIESWKRARADYQNLRRRQQADIDLAVARSREALLAELLLVIDTLEMALASDCHTEEAKNLQFGVQMVRHQMLQFLAGQGVVPLAEGGAFDPTSHQALETVASSEHAPGDVVETVRRGYRLGERMLRHAQVKVASDPDAASATDQASTSESF